jgi:hypothetical protein
VASNPCERPSVAVIGKYSPHSETPFIDHHFYSTEGMIHTMEGPDAVNAQELNAILWQDAKSRQALSGQK